MKNTGWWLLIGLLFLVCLCDAEAQQFSEGKFQAIFARSTLSYSDVNLTDSFNLSRDSVLKEINVATVLNGRYRLKYAAILPNSQTGTGIPLASFVINGYIFAPSDTDKKSTAPVTVETTGQSQRFEFECLQGWSTFFQPKLMGEYLTSNVKVTGKSSDNQKGDIVEAKDSFNKFLFGLGATGYQRQNSFLVKYEVAYTFADKGWFVDLGGRYDSVQGFVDIGWRLEQHTMGPFQITYQGPYADVGWKF